MYKLGVTAAFLFGGVVSLIAFVGIPSALHQRSVYLTDIDVFSGVATVVRDDFYRGTVSHYFVFADKGLTIEDLEELGAEGWSGPIPESSLPTSIGADFLELDAAALTNSYEFSLNDNYYKYFPNSGLVYFQRNGRSYSSTIE